MRLDTAQFDAIGARRGQELLARLDPLLLPYSDAYAAIEPLRRREMLGRVVDIARTHGIREELNIGLFCLLSLVWGVNNLRSHPTAQEILADAGRHGTAKVYQLWTLFRQVQPQARVFEEA